jgi:hypothetical protein
MKEARPEELTARAPPWRGQPYWKTDVAWPWRKSKGRLSTEAEAFRKAFAGLKVET